MRREKSVFRPHTDSWCWSKCCSGCKGIILKNLLCRGCQDLLGITYRPFPQGNSHAFSKGLLARQLWSGSHILEQEQELTRGVVRGLWGLLSAAAPVPSVHLPHIPGRFVAPSQHRFLRWEGQLDHPISAIAVKAGKGAPCA